MSRPLSVVRLGMLCLGAGLVVKLAMLAWSYPAMAIWSHLIQPGLDIATYQSQAPLVVPVAVLPVAVVALCAFHRVFRRRWDVAPGRLASSLWGANFLLDLPFLPFAPGAVALALVLAVHATVALFLFREVGRATNGKAARNELVSATID